MKSWQPVSLAKDLNGEMVIISEFQADRVSEFHFYSLEKILPSKTATSQRVRTSVLFMEK